jgi:hypothetical protein
VELYLHSPIRLHDLVLKSTTPRRRVDPRVLGLCTSLEVSGQLHAPTALSLGKEPPVPYG